MPALRQQLKPGLWDNITQRCPGMTYRFAPYAVEEVTAWLLLHQHRHALRVLALQEARRCGANVETELHYADAAMRAIANLASAVLDRWPVSQWHTACDLAADHLVRLTEEIAVKQIAGHNNTPKKGKKRAARDSATRGAIQPGDIPATGSPDGG